MKAPSIYPAYVPRSQAMAFFRAYVQQSKAFLDETYGQWWYDGTSSKKIFSYYEVDMRLLGPDKVKYTTYGMGCSVNGGRGDKQEEIVVEYPKEKLAPLVELIQMELAQVVYHERQREAEQHRQHMGVLSVYTELFGGAQ